MLKYKSAENWVSGLRMIASAAPRTPLVIGWQSSNPVVELPSAQYVQVPAWIGIDAFDSTVASHAALQIQALDSLSDKYSNVFLAYKLNSPDLRVAPSALCASACALYNLSVASPAINVTQCDISLQKLSSARIVPQVSSLDISRLHLNDESLSILGESNRWRRLRRLDLSCNSRVTIAGVASICKAINAGLMPALEHLELLGTACDATPYVEDGFWYSCAAAHDLAKEFGYQKWMMLGCRLISMEGVEWIGE